MNAMFAWLALGGAAGAGLAAWLWRRRRISPAERERRRRIALSREGRMTDGLVTDCHDGIIFYSYEVRGVEYAASQEISGLSSRLPCEPALLLGAASVKYSPGNPANSLVLSEEWSGLRRHKPMS